MITFKDVTGQTVFVSGPFVLLIPGPLSPGDGKCRVVAMGTVSEISHVEAARLRESFTPKEL
jgi:hypothetical protein